MKTIYFALATFAILMTSVFVDKTHASIPSDLQKFTGKRGDLEVYLKGKKTPEPSSIGKSCTFDYNPNQDWAEFDENWSNLGAGVGFSGDELKVAGEKSWKTSNTGKRPGGDACGDWGGMSGYKEIITVRGSILEYRQKFRCYLFEKNDTRFVCKFKIL